MLSALEALRGSSNTYARLAFCLPALTYGFNMESHNYPNVAPIHSGAIMEEVKNASLDLLRSQQYSKGFELLLKEESLFRETITERKNIKPARLGLAKHGGDKLLPGKEKMNETHQQDENDNREVLVSKTAIRSHFLALSRTAGISEEVAKAFFDVKEPLDEMPDSVVCEKDTPEVTSAIRSRFLALSRTAGISEEVAKEFFDAPSYVGN
jgi:hypothetical protein